MSSTSTDTPPPPTDAPAAPKVRRVPTGQKPLDYNDTLRGRSVITEFADPCELARRESMRCLDQNSYNKTRCTAFFQAYRDCKKEWIDQRRHDRRAGKDVA